LSATENIVLKLKMFTQKTIDYLGVNK